MRPTLPRMFRLVVLLLVAAALGVACQKAPAPEATQAPAKEPSAQVDPATLRSFAPLPDAVNPSGGAASAEQIALGRMLFYDPRLSRSQTISCNSCHDLAKYGVDSQPTSDGHKGQLGDRNSPTVYNAAGRPRRTRAPGPWPTPRDIWRPAIPELREVPCGTSSRTTCSTER